MKIIAVIGILSGFAMFAGCQPDAAISGNQNSEVQNGAQNQDDTSLATTGAVEQIVDVSCGQCQFGMDGTGCDLAIRINGDLYYVDGTSIDDHGNAHADDGLCNCVRQAKVSGEIEAGRFVATSLEVLPE